MRINNVAIIGAGAVGCAIGSVLHNNVGSRFSFVALGKREKRIREQGLLINGERIFPEVTSDKTQRDLDLVLICVKNYDLEPAIEDLRKVVNKNTIILPLLNGVTAYETVKEAFPENTVLYGIVMRTDANRTDENVTYKTLGEIQYGFKLQTDKDDVLHILEDFFAEANLNANHYDNMEYMLWRKWLVNIGSNQVSVLTGAKFKWFGEFEEIIHLMRDAMREIVLVAEKKNIGLTEKDLDEIEQILINYPPEKRTSMLQDLEARRRTEIDYFAGTVIKFGKELGVPTPVNQTLYYAIKAREKVYLAEKELEEQANGQINK